MYVDDGLMAWKVWLEGQLFDLEALARELTDGDIRVVYDAAEDSHCLTATKIDAAQTVVEASAAAKRIIGQINSLGRVRDANFQPIKLGRFTDEEGRNHVIGVMGITMAKLRVYAEGTVTRPDGTVDAPPPPALPRYLALLESDAHPDVAEALNIFSQAEPDWIGLYKVYEIVHHAVGDDMYDLGWATKAQTSTFRASANRADVSGDKARHARNKGSTPTRTMSLEEGRSFIGGLVTHWLDLLADRLEPDGT